MPRKTAYLVHSLVNNQYTGGYQVFCQTLWMAPNGVTVENYTEERRPADRTLTHGEASDLLRTLAREGWVAK